MICSRRLGPALGLLFALPVVALADDVYLKNGKSFQDVIATEEGAQVRIRMPAGELALPKEQVARIERGASAYGEYLARKSALGKTAGAPAWLALALWARGQGLDHGVREAALKAAALDSRLEGLAPVMQSLGFVFESDLGRWIPYADSMRRRGFQLWNGEWIAREEVQARLHREDEERARRSAEREAAARDRLTQTLELALVQSTLEREEARRYPPVAQVPVQVGYPVYYIAPVPVPPAPAPHPHQMAPGTPMPSHVPGALAPALPGNRRARIPGSLLPDDDSR